MQIALWELNLDSGVEECVPDNEIELAAEGKFVDFAAVEIDDNFEVDSFAAKFG